MTLIDPIVGVRPGLVPVGDSQPNWLVLAAEGQAVLAPDPRVAVTTVAAAGVFVRLLHDLLPSLAVVSSPPAGSDEVRAAVTERHRRTGLRLILLNDPGDVDGRLDALAAGFDEALPLTIDPDELTGRAHLMLDGERTAAVDPRQIAIAPGVVLDTVGRRVRRDGDDVHLRPKEFALLALLASDPGRVFSRDELVDGAWGVAYAGGMRTIDVHVRWLRAKIEPDPARPVHVITVRGAGYRLDP